MNLYSYIVRFDVGFAPNPFHGWCTLGTCKSDMRRMAQVGDWIVGTGSTEYGLSGKLVFVMRVEDALTFDQYWNDPRFQEKKPNLQGSYMQGVGDNIYHQGPDRRWIQADSHHSNHDGSLNQTNLDDDTKTNRVLISRDFAYWGGDAIDIKDCFMNNADGVRLCHDRQGYKVHEFSRTFIDDFVAWFRSLGQTGCQGDPAEFAKMLKDGV